MNICRCIKRRVQRYTSSLQRKFLSECLDFNERLLQGTRPIVKPSGSHFKQTYNVSRNFLLSILLAIFQFLIWEFICKKRAPSFIIFLREYVDNLSSIFEASSGLQELKNIYNYCIFRNWHWQRGQPSGRVHTNGRVETTQEDESSSTPERARAFFLVAKKQEIEKQIRAKFCGRYCYLRHHSLLQQAKKSVHWYISL